MSAQQPIEAAWDELHKAAEAADRSPWDVIRCDDGRLMVATFGDVIAHQDPNIAPGDAALAANYAHIVAAQPSTILRLRADHTRLTARVAKLEAVLREIAEASDKPADFKWHDSWGDPVNCDTSNTGDVSSHGFEWGQWSLALIARAVLTPEPR